MDSDGIEAALGRSGCFEGSERGGSVVLRSEKGAAQPKRGGETVNSLNKSLGPHMWSGIATPKIPVLHGTSECELAWNQSH